jgi:hypothetical protein
MKKIVTLGLLEPKPFLLLPNWVQVVPIFLELLSQIFFHGSINTCKRSKTALLFRFSSFHSIVQSEIDKMFEDKKIQFTAAVMGANVA